MVLIGSFFIFLLFVKGVQTLVKVLSYSEEEETMIIAKALKKRELIPERTSFF